MRPLAIATSSSSRTSSLPTPGFPPSRCPTPSPPCPFAALPVPWPPPLPAFVAAFVLTPTLWGPAALLPSCSIPSPPLPFPVLEHLYPALPGRAGDGLLAPAASSPQRTPRPDVWHPQILPFPPWRGGQEHRSREEPCFVYLRARAFCGDNEQ